LLAGAVAALYFSGNLNYVMGLVGLSKPAATATTTIEDQQKALEQQAADLAAKEEALSELQKKLDEQQAALDAQSVPSPSPTFETVLAGLSEEKLSEIKQVGAIYSKMDPAAAAEIISKIYDTQHIAIIIYNMQPAASALVLAKLDPALAADVTTLLAS
jgi:flagellar motility protein MotE (MotC chaperone)